ncbi:hypothetical protein QG37_02987 [Candidozyma auris]|uniref:Uncharacterized protein n=1 Tax=Candidozyma auris TaxID=498019 RepID=A0A0L0P228_CANAR|nr:hypothetical protein QG37_02987 [[Candida] auris]
MANGVFVVLATVGGASDDGVIEAVFFEMPAFGGVLGGSVYNRRKKCALWRIPGVRLGSWGKFLDESERIL